jgi:hypothetical protein
MRAADIFDIIVPLICVALAVWKVLTGDFLGVGIIVVAGVVLTTMILLLRKSER